MNRADYLSEQHVAGFLHWLTPRLAGAGALPHHWWSPRFGDWSCESLFDAYERYSWPFSVTLPGETGPTRGRTFAENLEVLSHLADTLGSSARDDDADLFLAASIAVVDWGGVRGNRRRLQQLGADALRTIKSSAEQLDPATADTSQLDQVIDMNAGFSKIYSLLLDGFPIYDSRVAAALSYLVRLYCEDTGLQTVPSALAFSLPAWRGDVRRDPSAGGLMFRRLWPGHPERYADSNLRAAWLLGEASRLGPFGHIPGSGALRALESALFMIGYSLPGTDQESRPSQSVRDAIDRPATPAKTGRRGRKYEPLREWLSEGQEQRVIATFSLLDDLVGGLPPSSRKYTSNWYGSAAAAPTHVWKQAWEDSGFTVDSVDLLEELVSFRRL